MVVLFCGYGNKSVYYLLSAGQTSPSLSISHFLKHSHNYSCSIYWYFQNKSLSEIHFVESHICIAQNKIMNSWVYSHSSIYMCACVCVIEKLQKPKNSLRMKMSVFIYAKMAWLFQGCSFPWQPCRIYADESSSAKGPSISR